MKYYTLLSPNKYVTDIRKDTGSRFIGFKVEERTIEINEDVYTLLARVGLTINVKYRWQIKNGLLHDLDSGDCFDLDNLGYVEESKEPFDQERYDKSAKEIFEEFERIKL
jgi:hypothetical protein